MPVTNAQRNHQHFVRYTDPSNNYGGKKHRSDKMFHEVTVKERYCTQTEKKKLIQISSLPNSTNGRKDTFDIENPTKPQFWDENIPSELHLTGGISFLGKLMNMSELVFDIHTLRVGMLHTRRASVRGLRASRAIETHSQSLAASFLLRLEGRRIEDIAALACKTLEVVDHVDGGQVGGGTAGFGLRALLFPARIEQLDTDVLVQFVGGHFLVAVRTDRHLGLLTAGLGAGHVVGADADWLLAWGGLSCCLSCGGLVARLGPLADALLLFGVGVG